MYQQIRISEKTYQKIKEMKPEKMSQVDFMDRLVDTAIASLEIQEEMKENQNEIMYKLREIWKIVHPAPDFEKEKNEAGTEEERKKIEDEEFRLYLENLTAGRKEKQDESGIRD